MDDTIQAKAECAAALYNVSVMLMKLGEDMASNVVLAVAKGIIDKGENQVASEVSEIVKKIESL